MIDRDLKAIEQEVEACRELLSSVHGQLATLGSDRGIGETLTFAVLLLILWRVW